MPPFSSAFIGTSVSDTSVNLFTGKAPVSTVLSADLADIEEEIAVVEDATGAAIAGYAVCEDEVFLYQQRRGANELLALIRAQGGTTAAAHLAGAVVELHPVFYLPAVIRDVIIELQNRVIALGG